MLGSTCFRHHCAHRQDLTTVVGYHIGRLVLELLLVGWLSAGWMSVRTEGCDTTVRTLIHPACT